MKLLIELIGCRVNIVWQAEVDGFDRANECDKACEKHRKFGSVIYGYVD